jgi:hypothetical protein
LVFGVIVAQNDHDPEGKKSRTPEVKKAHERRRKKTFQQKFRKKNPPEENTISNRRHYCIFIPPLTHV